MALSSGSYLGPYQILAQLGTGGMGEVYRARDTRLDRIVAIKVLPGSFASRPDHRERLEREARAIARLNHPHICSVHDIGRQDDVEFLVMEYLEGRTLADRLVAGPLPVGDVIRYGLQIADALDHAHRQGIIHRDLKPGNIMLTAAGAKLLDFGLAKLRPVEAIPDRSTVVIHGAPLTAAGAILGTFQYMAPEQLQGREVDFRADIFAFGAVMYEMTTGRRAFEGSTQASVIGAILHKDPQPMMSIQSLAPRALDRLVRRCLAKDPNDRWQTVRDLKFELDGIAQTTGAEGVTAPQATRGRYRERLVWMVAVAAAVSVGAAIARKWRPGPAAPASAPFMRLVLRLPSSAPVAVEDQAATVVALSPDSTRLVYVARVGNGTQLYVRPFDQFQPTPVPGTEGGAGPFFSPDGQRVAFFADRKLKTVDLDGGRAAVVCDAPTGRGGSWGPDDTIVFTPGIGAGLMRVPASGGAPRVLTTPSSGSGPTLNHRWPAILPGGKWVLFTLWTGVGRSEEARLALVSLATGEQRVLGLEGASNPGYSSTGHLVYLRSGSVMAAPFSVERLQVTGSPVPIAEGVAANVLGAAHFAVANNGTLVYVSAEDAGGNQTLRWVDRRGDDSPVAVSSRVLEEPRLSPDGTHLVVTKREANVDVWAYRLAEGALTRLTSELTEDETPVWMPDGRRITFAAARRAQFRLLFWRSIDAGGGEMLLLRSDKVEDHPHPDSWSPDGQTLALTNIRAPFEDADIWMLRPAETPRLKPFLQTQFNEGGARFSPDGRWLAYVSNESGRYEVYARPFPGPGEKRQVSLEGGTEPVWARRGNELFYRSGEKVIAATVTLTPEFSVQQRRVLFEQPFVPARRLHANYDVAPDGQRFLMVKEIGQTSAGQLRLVVGGLANSMTGARPDLQ